MEKSKYPIYRRVVAMNYGGESLWLAKEPTAGSETEKLLVIAAAHLLVEVAEECAEALSTVETFFRRAITATVMATRQKGLASMDALIMRTWMKSRRQSARGFDDVLWIAGRGSSATP